MQSILKKCKILTGWEFVLQETYFDADGPQTGNLIAATNKRLFNIAGIGRFGANAWSEFVDAQCAGEKDAQLHALRNDLKSMLSPSPSTSEKATPDAQMFKSILDQMFDTYVRKNNDYGNSFGDTYEAFGDLGIITAVTWIAHKYNRLISLAVKGVKARVEESIEDTLIDMANYCILTVIERRKEMARKQGAEVGGSQIEMVTGVVGDKADEATA